MALRPAKSDLALRLCNFEAIYVALISAIGYNTLVFINYLKEAMSKLPLPEFLLIRIVTLLGLTTFTLSTLPYIISIAVFFYLLQNADKEDFLRGE